MPSDPIVVALTTPGHLRFPCNEPFGKGLEQAGGRVERQPSGHLIFYRPDGLRFLSADPGGQVLHECEWERDPQGRVSLTRARIRLDWGRWVGIRPEGLINETRLNLATKSGWQRLTADDLRGMAAKALRVPLEEVKWFYRDEDLWIDRTGLATIRHRKDALYVLEDGDFARARFMSCMGAMHWPSIDFLPVVELFKSLLPGTGSAAFELIRGLYDDQNRDRPSPLPLRYRGIPTYPSEAAYRLFSSFFTPQAAGSRDPFTLFMDQTRAHEVQWLPLSFPPLRYFHPAPRCCLTCQGGDLQKVTLADDPAGLPFVKPRRGKIPLFDRSARVEKGRIVLRDRSEEQCLPLPLPADLHEGLPQAVETSPVDWRALFPEGLPSVSPQEAYGAVFLYPEDDREIGELEAQPFVADYLQDLAEQDREVGMSLAKANRVLIENGDAAAATCVLFDRPRQYTVAMRVPAFAQKQAQQLWTVCAGLQRWDWLTGIRFVRNDAATVQYDLAYIWMPYELADAPQALAACLRKISAALCSGARAFIVGSRSLSTLCSAHRFEVCWDEEVEGLPTFRMHRTILPKARLKAGLTLYHVRKV
ncbi:MAG TPA: hypothetical protein VFS39_05135 [Nitrospira sp.]|nr:hypothetical protein [Nitrospira sp.]